MSNHNLPKHVAIIMDGNRRWAKNKGLPGFTGHKKVVEETIEQIIQRAGEMGVEYLTLWAWSSENWRRPGAEVKAIMKLFRWALMHQAERMIKKGARLKVIGDIEAFDPDIQEGIRKMIEKSANNDKITVTFALNYGGRDEVVRAFKKLVDAGTESSEITKELISENLDTAGIPDPDLIIRTGGEQRLSGFMIWQAEYSEYYFTDRLMPDFTPSDFEAAISEFQRRERRFGGNGK